MNIDKSQIILLIYIYNIFYNYLNSINKIIFNKFNLEIYSLPIKNKKCLINK